MRTKYVTDPLPQTARWLLAQAFASTAWFFDVAAQLVEPYDPTPAVKRRRPRARVIAMQGGLKDVAPKKGRKPIPHHRTEEPPE